MDEQPPYPEYFEHLDKIQDPQVREAFAYLVKQAQYLTRYTARPYPHGYIENNLHSFDENGKSPYAFTINKKSLLFYLRMPEKTHPDLDIETLNKNFEKVKRKDNGEINFRIHNIDDAQAAMQLVFPELHGADEYSFPDEVPNSST